MSTDNSDRRSRLVMALGVVTIILFSANLLSVLAKHFWPDQSEVAFFESRAIAEDAVSAGNVEIDIDVRGDALRKHRIVMRFPKQSARVHSDGIDAEIADMERAARRIEMELNRELAKLNTEEIQFEVARAVEVARELGTGRHIAVQIDEELGDVIELELNQNLILDSGVDAGVDADLENKIRIEMKSTIEKIKRDLEKAFQEVEAGSDSEVSRVIVRKKRS